MASSLITHKKTFLVTVAITILLTIIPSNASFDYSLKTSFSPSSLPTSQVLDVTQKVEVPSNAKSNNVPSFVKSTMVGTMSKTKEFIQNVIDKKLANSAKMDHYLKDCLETCKEVYESAIDAMKKATQDVKLENFYKANVDISAMYSFIETCHECTVSTKENDLDFQKFQTWAKGMAVDCLDKVSKEYYKN